MPGPIQKKRKIRGTSTAGGPLRRKKSANAEHHHILRVDNTSNATRCWKIKIRREGVVTYKYFTDGRFGGKAKALEAAKAYRDTLMRDNSGPEYAMWRRSQMRPTNTSGIVGVGRYIKRYKTRGGVEEKPRWQAYWKNADGRRQSRWFSVSDLGEDRAKRLACRARSEGMEEVRQELLRRGRIVLGRGLDSAD